MGGRIPLKNPCMTAVDFLLKDFRFFDSFIQTESVHYVNFNFNFSTNWYHPVPRPVDLTGLLTLTHLWVTSHRVSTLM